jgi:hypothetical protein
MGRADKLYRRLDMLEAAFAEELAEQLVTCAEGVNDLLFWSREFLPSHYPTSISTDLADKLLATVEVIRGLRVKVGEPFEGSLAWRYRECCRKWADHSDHHRGSAQSLAQRLLTEMKPEQ